MPNAPLLELKGLCRHFSVRRGMFQTGPASVMAVDNVSLTLPHGRSLGLVGESGCGKSTLARMVVGLLPPSSGHISWEGRSLTSGETPRMPEQMQMIFQDPFSSLNPRLSVGASVAEPLMLARRRKGKPATKPELKAEVCAMLARVGLGPEHYARYPHEFSGGQRQRVAVARALINHPRLIVCDEPVSALDASVQAQVLNLLKDVQDDLGLSYLFISHDLNVVGFMSNHVAVMYLGRIVEIASRAELFHHPAHPYTKALLAAAPSRVPGVQRQPLAGELPSPLSPPPGCAFHPRCPLAQPICREHAPKWTEHSGHGFCCHFPS